MNAEIRPLIEVNERATSILIREMGVVDTLRFLTQFSSGFGDYTKDRQQWIDGLSLAQITSEIKAKRQADATDSPEKKP